MTGTGFFKWSFIKTGKRVNEQDTVNVSAIPAGIYYVRVYSVKKELMGVLKVVVRH